MKTYIRVLTVLVYLFLLNVSISYSQFNGASYTEYNVSSPSYISNSFNSGNDLAEYDNSRFEVTVFDSNSPLDGGMIWNITGNINSDGYIKFSYTATGYLDPDVCLVYDANNNVVIAVAVYLASVYAGPGVYNNEFVMECFPFDVGSNQFVNGWTTQVGTYSTGGSIPSDLDFEINIDGEVIKQDKFAITWNDDQKNYVFARLGWVDNCAYLCDNTVTIYDAAGVGDGSETTTPDVAYNYDKVYFVYRIEDYVGPTQWDKFEVCSLDVSTYIESLCEELHPSVIYQSPANYAGNWDDPRIACPNINTSVYGANTDDWSVIVSSTDYAYFWDMIGVNYFNGSGTTYTSSYTNGFYSPSLDISALPQYEPAIAYTEDGSITVGWLFDNNSVYGNSSTSAELRAYYPVALNCDQTGTVLGGAWYMNVPQFTVGSGNDVCSSISIAGRNCTCSGTTGPENLFSFGVDNDDIYTKTVPEGAAALRLASNDLKNEDISIIAFLYSSDLLNRIDANKQFELKVYDLLSKQVLTIKGNISTIRQVYSEHQQSLNSGVYIAQIEDRELTISATGKLFVNNIN